MNQAEQRVLRRVCDRETLELARSLIRIPSIAAEEGPQLSDFLYDWLQQARLSPVRQSVPPEPPEVLESSTRITPPDPEKARARHNIAAGLAGAQPGPTLLFEGHQDTKWVDGMSIDPFGAEVRNGLLYGRGAADMKGALAAMLVAMKALRESGLPLRGELRLAFEVGEEIHTTGIETMGRAGLLQADMAVVGEPSDLAVQIGSRGSYRFRIALKGQAAHSGLAQLGVNAIQKMATVIRGLYGLRFLRDDDPMWGAPTMNVQRITGGGRWEASVADDCTIWVDVRTTPHHPADEVDRHVRRLLEELSADDPEIKCEVEPYAKLRAPQAISADDPLVASAVRAVERVRGQTPPIGTCPGVTTAAVLIQTHRIPAIILGPGHLAQAHGKDEWAEIQQITDAARIYALLGLYVLEHAV